MKFVYSVTVAFIGLLAMAIWFAVRPHGPSTVEVSTDAEFARALRSAGGGETIVLRPGTYGRHQLPKPYAARLTIRGADRRAVQVGGFSTFEDATPRTAAANVLITDMTISTRDRNMDAIRINRYAHDIAVSDVTIRGGRHSISINAQPYGGEQWPFNISVRDSDLFGSWGDLVQIAGGRHLLFERNFIHDPLDNPDDHVDGIQSIASDALRIVANSFTEPSEGTTGVNQAIILGRADPYDPALSVRNSYVANNLVYGWRGSGILLAGTSSTWVVNNTSVPHSGQSGFVTAEKSPQGRGGSSEDWFNSGLKVWNNIFNKVKVSTDSGPGPVFNSNNLILTDSQRFGANCIVGLAHFVTVDPASRQRYTLQRSSPAVNSGAMTPDGLTPETDLGGRRRQGLPDRGAREYLGSPPS
jgi:hypothetical protein